MNERCARMFEGPCKCSCDFQTQLPPISSWRPRRLERKSLSKDAVDYGYSLLLLSSDTITVILISVIIKIIEDKASTYDFYHLSFIMPSYKSNKQSIGQTNFPHYRPVNHYEEHESRYHSLNRSLLFTWPGLVKQSTSAMDSNMPKVGQLPVWQASVGLDYRPGDGTLFSWPTKVAPVQTDTNNRL